MPLRNRGKPGVLLVHPGTQHSFRLAKQLSRLGLLTEFWTGLAIHRDGPSYRALWSLLGDRGRRALANRVLEGIPFRALKTRPWIELSAMWKLRRGDALDIVMHDRNRRFQQAIPESAFTAAQVVVGFDTASWILGERAKAAGIPLVLDRSAPPESARVRSALLRKAYPEWAEHLGDENTQVVECERLEHERAACIVAASTFTRQCLVDSGVDSRKIAVIPYGVDTKAFLPSGARPASRQVRFLFAGAVGARKGLPLLLEVWSGLASTGAELTVVGPLRPDTRPMITGIPGVTIMGKVPHVEMPLIFAANDVFVFPSYFEGFGMVILEAMAAGLPVITTQSTAGPDLITDGEDGFITAVGDTAALASRMRFFIENPGKARQMGSAAREKAKRFTWEAYGDAWGRLLGEKGFIR